MGEGTVFSLSVHTSTGGGGTPSQVSVGGGWYSIPCLGGGYPIPGLDGGGVPPLARTGWGTPHPPIRQSSIASTCYVAAGMPLAFTQEDFLVVIICHQIVRTRKNGIQIYK